MSPNTSSLYTHFLEKCTRSASLGIIAPRRTRFRSHDGVQQCCLLACLESHDHTNRLSKCHFSTFQWNLIILLIYHTLFPICFPCQVYYALKATVRAIMKLILPGAPNPEIVFCVLTHKVFGSHFIRRYVK